MTDYRVYEAAMKLRNLPEFAAFLDWLKQRREVHRDALENLPEGSPYWRTQGRAVEVKEILDLIEQSPDVLDKLRTRNAGSFAK